MVEKHICTIIVVLEKKKKKLVPILAFSTRDSNKSTRFGARACGDEARYLDFRGVFISYVLDRPIKLLRSAADKRYHVELYHELHLGWRWAVLCQVRLEGWQRLCPRSALALERARTCSE